MAPLHDAWAGAAERSDDRAPPSLAMGAAGCGSSGQTATTTTTTTTTTAAAAATPGSSLLTVRLCLRHNGYAVSPESAADRGTAPGRFEFVAIWNVLNPSRVSLALTFSRSVAGAQRAAVWTRHENAAIGRRAVIAPVVRVGKIDVLWTTQPGPLDKKGIYGCLHRGT